MRRRRWDASPVDAGVADLCTISSHKLGGPLGIGALVVRRGVALRPLAWGGEQERGLRPGTENAGRGGGLRGGGRGVAGAWLAIAELRERLWSAASRRWVGSAVTVRPAMACRTR